ncbi:cytochrome P450 [Planomonospora alba]|uniref:Cytochrome P450 n=1 Tax=Planomonospora alba TaxID=161354 RepID=A0ABP6NHL3_9ACTN
MKATYPFGPVPPAEGMEIIRALHADRPMTKVSFAYGGDAWVVHGYEACRQLLEDRRFVRKPFRDGRVVPYAIEFPEFLTKTLQFMDPPDHTRLRRLVAKAFTMRRVEALRPSTEALAERLIEKMTTGRATANLVEAYALPLPIQVIGDLLGVPDDGRANFVKWSHALLSTSGMAEETVAEHAASLFMYLLELITAKRAAPADDLLSALAAAQEADDRLEDGEIVEIAMLLVLGGFDNTANFIEQGVLSLLLNPEHRAYLAEDVDGRIGPAVEEILRHAGMEMGKEVEGRVGLVPFAAAEDLELAGAVIRKGEAVMVDLGSANHDDRAFDEAGRFDLARTHNPHLTFSHGLHRCLGASLATMELQVGIGTLLKRLPELALAGDPVYLEGVLTGGMTDLPVAW